MFKKIGKAIKNAVSNVIQFERELRRKILRAIGEIEGLSTVISIVIAIYCQYCAMAFNAAMADANGGTIGQILTGAAISFIAYGVPGSGGGLTGALTKGMTSTLARTGVNLAMGGVAATAQGGKFIDGVKGAALGMAAGAVGRGYTSATQAGAPVFDEIMHELRILASVKPPASVRYSTAVHEIGQAPEFVSYSGPTHTDTYIPAWGSIAPANTMTGFSSTASQTGFTPQATAKDMIDNYFSRQSDLARSVNKAIGLGNSYVGAVCWACRGVTFWVGAFTAGVESTYTGEAYAYGAGFATSFGLERLGVHGFPAQQVGAAVEFGTDLHRSNQ